jgi:hypothetical protein
MLKPQSSISPITHYLHSLFIVGRFESHNVQGDIFSKGKTFQDKVMKPWNEWVYDEYGMFNVPSNMTSLTIN